MLKNSKSLKNNKSFTKVLNISIVALSALTIVFSLLLIFSTNAWAAEGDIWGRGITDSGKSAQNGYVNEGNNPSSRNYKKMMEYADKWAEAIILNFEIKFGDIRRSSDRAVARAIFEWMVNATLPSEEQELLYTVDGKRIQVQDMDFEDMQGYIGPRDPYSVLCKATKKWSDGKRIELSPLEFAVLYQLLLYKKGINATVEIGSITAFGSTEYTIQGTKYIYYPPARRTDFRVAIREGSAIYRVDIRSAINATFTEDKIRITDFFDISSRDESNLGWRYEKDLKRLY